MENNEFYTWPPKEPKKEMKKPDFKRAGKTLLAVVQIGRASCRERVSLCV